MTQLRCEDAHPCPLDVGPTGMALGQRAWQTLCALLPERFLDVKACPQGQYGVTQPQTKSETATPRNPHWSRRMLVSSGSFWPHHSPLTEL